MTGGTGVLAAGAVLTGAWCWAGVVRWVGAGRAWARLGLPGPAGRPVPRAVALALTSAGISGDHRSLVRGWMAAVGVTALAAAFTTGGVILLAVAIVVPPGAVLAARGRAGRQRARRLPLVLDGVAAGLRGGASLRASIEDAADGIGGPLGLELGLLASRAGAGLPLADVLADWADSAHDPGTRLAGASLVVAAQLGGPGATAVDAAAASLRDRTAAHDEVAALSVQARLSALLLAAAPVVFAFLLTSVDPTSARFLLRTPAGWSCLVLGLVLDAAGAAWMARIVRSSR